MVQGWKKCFFVLQDKVLSYFTMNREQTLGKIHMSVATLQEQPENELKFILKTGSGTLKLRASSKENKKKWLDALKLSMQQINSQEQQY